MIRGFDASSAQGVIPFGLLSPDYRFAIFKAQQGNDGFDPTFKHNVDLALARGLEPFPYCFAYPLAHIQPKDQAKLFVERVYAHPAMVGRPIFIDCEWPAFDQWKKWNCTAQQISDELEELCSEVADQSGVEPTIYTYDDWWEGNKKTYHGVSEVDTSWAARYALWMAWYVKGWPADGDKPRIPSPWLDWLFWQFDGDGGLKLPNGADADFCVFNGDEEALQKLAGKAPPRPVDLIEGLAA